MAEQPLVLVVDDEPAMLRMLRLLLTGSGLDVTTAENGTEALARVHERLPTVIVLDLQMPEMDGQAFAAQLRIEHLEVPIVIVSAREDTGQVARDISAAAWVRKPFDAGGWLIS